MTRRPTLSGLYLEDCLEGLIQDKDIQAMQPWIAGSLKSYAQEKEPSYSLHTLNVIMLKNTLATVMEEQITIGHEEEGGFSNKQVEDLRKVVDTVRNIDVRTLMEKALRGK
jgi:diphthamide synthase (EF-2-diphthine--ammonia ligase)